MTECAPRACTFTELIPGSSEAYHEHLQADTGCRTCSAAGLKCRNPNLNARLSIRRPLGPAPQSASAASLLHPPDGSTCQVRTPAHSLLLRQPPLLLRLASHSVSVEVRCKSCLAASSQGCQSCCGGAAASTMHTSARGSRGHWCRHHHNPSSFGQCGQETSVAVSLMHVRS